MRKLLAGLGFLGLALTSVAPASASTIFEDIVVSYTSTQTFTLSSLSFAETGVSGATNLLGSYSGGTYNAPSGTVLSETLELISGQSYTFSYVGSYLGNPLTGSASMFAGPTPTGGGAFNFVNTGATFTVSSSISPVPLPASAPLFGLALLALGFFAYNSARAKKQLASDGEACATAA
jgi:hypothetical protein